MNFCTTNAIFKGRREKIRRIRKKIIGVASHVIPKEKEHCNASSDMVEADVLLSRKVAHALLKGR